MTAKVFFFVALGVIGCGSTASHSTPDLGNHDAGAAGADTQDPAGGGRINNAGTAGVVGTGGAGNGGISTAGGVSTAGGTAGNASLGGEAGAGGILGDGGTTFNDGGAAGESGSGGEGVDPVLWPPGPPVVAMAAGESQTCVLADSGTVYCWGAVNGWPASQPARPVALASKAVAVDSGGQQACALLDTGHVQCWDYVGTTDTTALAELGDVISFSVHSWYHGCLATSGGLAYCWGRGEAGQLGIGVDASVYAPTQVKNLTGVVKVAVGGTNSQDASANHSCAVVKNGDAYCWGANKSGQLGRGTYTNSNVPGKVSKLTKVDQLCAGAYHTCALSAGEVYCWGTGGNGELGNGANDASPLPVKVKGLSLVAEVGCGNSHNCALTEGGEVFCWGAQAHGRIGNGLDTVLPINEPSKVAGLSDVVELTVGGNHSCARLKDGQMECWGMGELGELGNGKDWDVVTPVRVLDLLSPKSIAAGSYHTCAALADGHAACWGHSVDIAVQPGPETPKPLPGLSDVQSVTAGAAHNCALHTNGEVSCWGWDQVNDWTSPSGIGLSDVTSIDAGDYFTCAALGNGDAYCWGKGESGKLGNGSVDDSGGPVQVTIDSVSSVSAGTAHACALLKNQDVYCWGDNFDGQLGNDSQLDHSALPVRVLGMPKAVELASGGNHSCTVTSTGAVWCWGDNLAGQLGDGTIDDAHAPVQVKNLGKALHVAVGRDASCAIVQNGDAYCWGTRSELGDGSEPIWTDGSLEDTGAHSVVPVKVHVVKKAVAITLGEAHACATQANGHVYCWGFGGNGEIGDGRPWWSTPQLVDWRPAPIPE